MAGAHSSLIAWSSRLGYRVLGHRWCRRSSTSCRARHVGQQRSCGRLRLLRGDSTTSSSSTTTTSPNPENLVQGVLNQTVHILPQTLVFARQVLVDTGCLLHLLFQLGHFLFTIGPRFGRANAIVFSLGGECLYIIIVAIIVAIFGIFLREKGVHRTIHLAQRGACCGLFRGLHSRGRRLRIQGGCFGSCSCHYILLLYSLVVAGRGL
mmetsp:Transcript_10496/g.21595  ORF Transcript_10496/g.21595 Transcript_10496/m.21595 type:complete len:208 (-) Transcript_10496:263-886(-)